jgi:DNA-binding MarR family transcriptional regulator
MRLYEAIKEIYFSLDHGDRQLLEEFNLSVPRFFLLKHIDQNPGISLTQLSVRMLSDKSNITRLIKAVEDDGLVQRERHQADRRIWSLYLTRKGKKVLDDAAMAHDSYTRERFKGMKTSTERLLSDLKNIRDTLNAQLENLQDQ